MKIRTKRGARRTYNAIMNKAFRAMKGGLSFGMDWPTFRITFPEDYRHIKEIRAAYHSLPE